VDQHDDGEDEDGHDCDDVGSFGSAGAQGAGADGAGADGAGVLSRCHSHILEPGILAVWSVLRIVFPPLRPMLTAHLFREVT